MKKKDENPIHQNAQAYNIKVLLSALCKERQLSLSVYRSVKCRRY